jgi:hypothetical protein
MSVVNGSAHREEKVEENEGEINSLVRRLREEAAQREAELFASTLLQVQEAQLERVWAGEAELVCTRCGLVHSGVGTLSRRGTRKRQVVTQRGTYRFALLQLSCRSCHRTWSPGSAWLGLLPRQRILQEVEEKLVELVLHLSYGRTCQVGKAWLGAHVGTQTLHGWVQKRAERLVWTAAPADPADPQSSILIADGTKVPTGTRSALGEDVRIGFQLCGREIVQGRSRAQLRVVGVGLGAGSWAQALPAALEPALVVTDAEPALRTHVRTTYPQARHQLCEWHVGHTLDWSLLADRVPVARRRRLQRMLLRILFRHTTQARKRTRYERFTHRIGSISPTAQKQLRQAADFILYETASAECTTSLAERQMREVNRRMEPGVRWSDRGALNLLRLRLAHQHNPDDYARLWWCN